jgi:hypothetical protein
MERPLPDKEGKIVGHVVLSREDLENAADSSGRFKLALALVVMAALLLALGVGIGGWQTDSWLTLVFPAVFAVLLGLYFRYLQKKTAGRMFAKQPEAELDTTFELDESGYLRKTGLSSSQAAWSTLNSHHETKSSFVVFSSHAGYVVLPKRAFRDEDIDVIRVLLRTHVKGSAPNPKQLRLVVALWVLLIVTFAAVWFGLGDSGPSPGRHEHGAKRHQPTTEQSPRCPQTRHGGIFARFVASKQAATPGLPG